MNTARIYIWPLSLIITVAGLMLSKPLAITAQPTSVTYENPLAYVGADHNLYITSLDGTRATAIALNTSSPEGGAPYSFSAPHWSPKGTQLAFVDQNFDAESGRLYRVESGKVPEVLVANIELEHRALAWSPDGKQLAYVEGRVAEIGIPQLHVIQLDSATNRVVMPLEGGCIVEAPGLEDAFGIVIEDRDQFGYTAPFTLNWTDQGLLLSMHTCGSPTTLFSSDGKIVWQSTWEMVKLIVSPDNTRAVFGTFVNNRDDQSYTEKAVLIDLANGHELPLLLASGIEPLAWTSDGNSIIYSTRTPLHTIKHPYAEDGIGVNEDFMLTLWRQGLNEKQGTKLFQYRGYDFGTVAVSPDNTMVVFSLIVNKVFDKLNPAVQIVAVPLNGGQANWIAIGGKPAFGKGPFTAIPATPPAPVQPKRCLNSLPSQLQIGQRARVTPRTTNTLRAQPVDGTFLNSMPAGSVFLVLKGPVCAADGIAWWMVNYHGAIGWTAESNSKNYWLE